MTHEHHGHHDHGADRMGELDAFMNSLEENATAAVKAVVEAVTTGSPHDHHGHGADHQAHHVHNGAGDHSAHDHSGHNMKMWFHGGCEEVILFDFWRTSTWPGLYFSCLLIFIMGAAYEGIKWFRVYLQLTQTASQKCPVENGIQMHEAAPLHCQSKRSTSADEVYNPTTTPPASRTHVIRSSPISSSHPFALPRLIQAGLYILQLVLAYWLMLIAMTYNTYLTMAVIFGAGFGHWLFAVLKFRNPLGETADSFATDACH